MAWMGLVEVVFLLNKKRGLADMGHLCTHYMEDLFPNLEASHGLDGVGGGGGVGVGPGVGVHTIAEGIVGDGGGASEGGPLGILGRAGDVGHGGLGEAAEHVALAIDRGVVGGAAGGGNPVGASKLSEVGEIREHLLHKPKATSVLQLLSCSSEHKENTARMKFRP